jgi:hypothetical protein
MKRFDDTDDPRRRTLIQLLTAGVFLPQSISALAASVFGDPPRKLPEGQSIFRIDGTATVNGQPANLKTQIKPGDTVQTGPKSELVFVSGGHSMIMRADSRMTLETAAGAASTSSSIMTGLRMLSGKFLSVSRNSRVTVTTGTATMGIRGTGFYVEAEPDRTYFCTCYGITEVGSIKDPDSKETIAAKQHDRPVYILANEERGKNIRNAPFVNHTDQELMLIETLVGRTPPFAFPKDIYNAPRRSY